MSEMIYIKLKNSTWILVVNEMVYLIWPNTYHSVNRSSVT